MRSSKSRSRSKTNRNRSVGNIVNRVFDSSGPEGKVRGTPQQIIDKYNQLARDAQLSNDRVAFENFQQHAEHYTRMLAEAQREQDMRRDQDMQQRDRQQGRPDDDEGAERDDRREDRRDGRPHVNGHDSGEERQDDRFVRPEPVEEPAAPVAAERPSDVIDTGIDAGTEGDSTLVETPESRPAPRPRRRRRPPAEAAPAGDDQPRTGETETAD